MRVKHSPWPAIARLIGAVALASGFFIGAAVGGAPAAAAQANWGTCHGQNDEDLSIFLYPSLWSIPVDAQFHLDVHVRYTEGSLYHDVGCDTYTARLSIPRQFTVVASARVGGRGSCSQDLSKLDVKVLNCHIDNIPNGGHEHHIHVGETHIWRITLKAPQVAGNYTLKGEAISIWQAQWGPDVNPANNTDIAPVTVTPILRLPDLLP